VPVWHASVSNGRPAATWGRVDRRLLEKLAWRALDRGGGHPAWLEIGANALHYRRRVTASELAIVGPARDIRDQHEEGARLDALRAELPLRILAMLGLTPSR
jgi:hypothetical protein